MIIYFVDVKNLKGLLYVLQKNYIVLSKPHFVRFKHILIQHTTLLFIFAKKVKYYSCDATETVCTASNKC